ncbi:hypothetical protein LCGC14_0842770 [marine sediment metagenome]|uniref:Uncharacterized protein n=1 Tax=marine sediment metagenome TaxID=412755 RepID=A0A0F9PXT0_9ZZZZ
MRNPLAGIGLRGKRADDDDAKAEEDEDEMKAAAEAEAAEAEAAKAQEEDEDEDDEDDDDEDEPFSKKDARRLAAKAERKAARELRGYAREVADLCTLAGKAELAAEFIAKNVSVADVRKTLLGQRASASSAAEIAGHTGPDSGRTTAALWDKAVARTNARFSPGTPA